MKKLYLLLAFVTSLFFFSSSVSASTYNFTVTDNEFAYLNEFSTVKSVIESSSYFSTFGPNYIVFKRKAGANIIYQIWFYSSTFNSSVVCADSQVHFYGEIPSRKTYAIAGMAAGEPYVYDVGLYFSNQDAYNTTSNYYSILYYSKSPIPYCSQGDTFNFTYNGNTYTQVSSSENLSGFATLYDLYGVFVEPPAPTDDYPLLTGFYTTFIDRLSFVADEVSHNYMFLSIFVVFTILFSVLLLRRLK